MWTKITINEQVYYCFNGKKVILYRPERILAYTINGRSFKTIQLTKQYFASIS